MGLKGESFGDGLEGFLTGEEDLPGKWKDFRRSLERILSIEPEDGQDDEVEADQGCCRPVRSGSG